MTDETGIIAATIKSIVANATVISALWGAAGGLTSALSITDDEAEGRRGRAAVRQVVIGSLLAAGGGTTMGAAMAHWMGLPPQQIPAFGASGAMAYMTGVFGPAIIEVVLQRIRAGRLPSDGEGND